VSRPHTAVCCGQLSCTVGASATIERVVATV
jgi:hypothetical protein